MGSAAFVEALTERGVFVNDVAGRFTEGFGVRAESIAAEFEALDIATVAVASTHGFATGIEAEVDALRDEDPATYAATMDLLERTASDPSLFGTAGHLLYVGRTPTS